MLDLSTLEKYDKSRMYTVYDRWPQLARESYYETKYDLIDFKGINHVVFVGMGGSGAIGDALCSILSKTKVHLCVVKGYHLPNTADTHTLVVATSASGNTAETLTVLRDAKKTGCKMITFSSGGKLEQYCTQNKIEYRKIPQLNSPRASFSIYLYSILKVLGPLIPVKESDVDQSIRALEKIQKKIWSASLNEDNPSLSLAKWLASIAMIYYPVGLEAAAIRFKNSLQENAKMHAMAEDVLEVCHNGIVAWERSSKVRPILIEGRDDYIKTKEVWKILKKYFETNKIEYREVCSVEGSILSKLINLIYLLDYSTIYRAVMSKIDPTPVRSIDFVKRKLGVFSSK